MLNVLLAVTLLTANEPKAMCTIKGEYPTGRGKICYYDCRDRSVVGITIPQSKPCPPTIN